MKQQAIAQTNVDPDLCPMASLGHSEVIFASDRWQYFWTVKVDEIGSRFPFSFPNVHDVEVSIVALYIFIREQGAVSIRKTVLPGMAIPMLKIRHPNGRLIFNMEIAIRR